MTVPNGDWQRLSRQVVARRTALGLTQRDVQALGGPSTATQRLIESGRQQSFQAVLLGRLERALQWEPGSVAAVLAGGDPTPAKDERTRQDREARSAELDREVNEERERLRELTEQLQDGDLPLAAAYLQALIDRNAG